MKLTYFFLPVCTFLISFILSNIVFSLSHSSSFSFKLDWAIDWAKPQQESSLQAQAKQLLADAVKDISPETLEQHSPPKKKSFLLFPKVAKCPIDSFLQSETTDTLNVLDGYPALKSIFLRLNSNLPSSAPVERLFSVGGLVFSPKRSKLSDANFESLVLLKYNQKWMDSLYL